jgi:4'-phosphopantetheinyl transferase
LDGTSSACSFESRTLDLWLVYPQSIVNEALLARYRSITSAKEHERIDRFHFEKDRHTALVARAFVRCLISCYLGGDPRAWDFGTVANGKPVLTSASGAVEFNISHKRNVIAGAIIPGQGGIKLGVDVEPIAEDSEVLAVASRFFAKDEVTELNTQAPDNRLARFCEYWTLKESYIKASGQGLSIPLMDFSFHFPVSPLPSAGYTPEQISVTRRNDPNGGNLHCRSWLLPAASNLRIAISLLAICTVEAGCCQRQAI